MMARVRTMRGRALPMKRKRPRPAASPVAHDCVILAIDAAETSGWAIFVAGELRAFGECHMLRDPSMVADICLRATTAAMRLKLHAVLVYERPFGGTMQGQYQGAWKMSFVEAGGKIGKMVGVYPATWRTRVLGPGWGFKRRDQTRAFEQAVASRLVARSPSVIIDAHHPGPDASAAICIGMWSRLAGEIGRKLGKRKPT